MRGKIALMAAVVLIALSDLCFGQHEAVPAAKQVYQAVVMIDNRGCGGGSGAYIGDGFVLTCDHLFRDESGRPVANRVVVSFVGGQASAAKLVKQDPQWDLALLKLDHPPKEIVPIKVAIEPPRPGESVAVCGYGPNGAAVISPCVARAFGPDKQGTSREQGTLLSDGEARKGDSGGPILNTKGELCGVLWGSGSGSVVGTHCVRARSFAAISESGCPGGVCPTTGVQFYASPRQSFSGSPQPAYQTPAPISQPNMRPVVPSQPAANCPCDQEKMARLDQSLSRVEQSLLSLQAKLDAIESRPGPAGPQGPPGRDASVNIDAVIQRLKPIVQEEVRKNLRVTVTPE